MTKSVYEQHAEFYLDFVERQLVEDGFLHVHMTRFTALLSDRLQGTRVCDVGCGEGYLGRYLVRHGAREVIGVDLSQRLIDVAIQRSDSPNLSYRIDDAHELQTIPDGSVGVVVSQLALMDILDHRRMFRAARRILHPGGVFAFSVLHPCFEGRPFHFPDNPPLMLDEQGVPTAYLVRRYATEGFWHSGGDGMRGHMGAYHRTLATYINDLIRCGFCLEYMEEPLLANSGLHSEVPTTLTIIAQAGECKVE
jgi:ubiquinone/menaquinone biosynthesis C-methylase UbiE